MKRVSIGLGILLLIAATLALAQTSQRQMTLTWVLPTTAIDGSALTGAQALTKIQVFVATATIPDNSTMTPTAELGPGVTSSVQTVTIAPGGTAFVRLKACNAPGCSDFSAQASKVFPPSVPNVPTTVTITVIITPPP